jgi:hypothetical protein
MSSGYPSYGGMQSLPCQRCHAPLLPNEPTCRNCGYYNAAPVQGPPPSNASWGNFTAQPSQSQAGPPSWGQFPAQPVAPPTMQPPQAQNFPNPPSAPLQMSGGNFFGAPAQPSSSPMQANNGYVPNQAAPPAYTMAPPALAPQRPSGALSTGSVGPLTFGGPANGPAAQVSYGTPAPDFQQYGAQPSGFQQSGVQPSGSQQYGAQPSGFQQSGVPSLPGQSYPGIGGFDASRPPSAGIQPFPVAGAGPASAAGSSGFAQPAFNEESAARRPKPSMIILVVVLVAILAGGSFAGYTLLNKHASATVTPTSVVTSGVPKSPPLFADTFKNNANKWSLQADPGKFSISLAGNALVLEDDNNELLWEPLPSNKTFADFTLSFDAMLARGDQVNGYGVYIRGSSVQNADMATYYRFELYGDGSYAIFKGIVDASGTPTSSKLVDYTLSSVIQKQGIINHVTVTAKGSTLSLMVNGQVVKTITDSSYADGAIAPFVSNMQNAKPGAQAKFSNFMLYKA